MAMASSTACAVFGSMNVFLEGEVFFIFSGNYFSKFLSFLISLVC